MKVILREDIDGVGKRGDICDVADGYARNLLLPTGQFFLLAVEHMAAYHRWYRVQ